MGEIVSKRTYNQKHYDNGDGTFTMESSAGHIHYKDDNGDFQDSDLSLEDMGQYWQMVKHNYRLRIAKDFSAPLLLQYQNKYEGANHTITYEPKMLAWVNNPDMSDMQVFRNQQAVQGVVNGNVIRWTDAFGDGIHFEVTIRRRGFRKEIVIDAKDKLETPPTAQHKLVALFQYGGTGLKVRANDKQSDWNDNDYEESDAGFEIKEVDETKKSFIRPAYIEDSAEVKNRQLIKVFWKKHNNKLYQAKVLPKAFLNNAVYPVRADTDTDYNPNTGDNGNSSHPYESVWSTARSRTTSSQLGAVGGGTLSDATYGWSVFTRYHTTNGYVLGRSWTPFDTSGLGASATISAAVYKLYITVAADNDGDATSYIAVVESTQASDTTLVAGDFDEIGSTAWSSTLDLTAGVTTNAYNNMTLNATGLAGINKTGYTKLALREGHDLENETPDMASTGYNGIIAQSADGLNPPILTVTYTVGTSFTPKVVFF